MVPAGMGLRRSHRPLRRMGGVTLAALVAALVLASSAAAAPKPGLWIAKRGAGQLSFTIARQHKGLVLGNVTVACGNRAVRYPYMSSAIDPDHWTVTRSGGVRGWPRSDVDHPGRRLPAPRFRRTSARIVAPNGQFCGVDPHLTARPAAPRFPRDGTWAVSSYNGVHGSFLVMGGGILVDYYNGTFVLPEPGEPRGGCFVDPPGWEGARINAD